MIVVSGENELDQNEFTSEMKPTRPSSASRHPPDYAMPSVLTRGINHRFQTDRLPPAGR